MTVKDKPLFMASGILGDTLRRQRPALILWIALLSIFLITVVLYARYSEPFILKVYELMQIDRAQARDPVKALDDYGDYLRVDPSSVRVQALLVNTSIDLHRYEDAVRQAEEALRYARPQDRRQALLIAARAYRANGDPKRALEYLKPAVIDGPDSGEVHYELAMTFLALRDSQSMEREFEKVRTLGSSDSSREYADDWKESLRTVKANEEELGRGSASFQRLIEIGADYLRVGHLAKATDVYSQAAEQEERNFTPRSAWALFAYESITINRIYVDAKYSGIEFGTQSRPYRALAQALASARSGDTIILRSGTLTEEISVDQLISLKAFESSLQ